MNKKYIAWLFLIVSSFVHGSLPDKNEKRLQQKKDEWAFVLLLLTGNGLDAISKLCKEQATLYRQSQQGSDETVEWLVSTCYDGMVKGLDAEYNRLHQEQVIIKECYQNSYRFYTSPSSIFPRRCPKNS